MADREVEGVDLDELEAVIAQRDALAEALDSITHEWSMSGRLLWMCICGGKRESKYHRTSSTVLAELAEREKLRNG